MSLSKQELFDRIRRDSWQQKPLIRALSRKYGVHRRLVCEVTLTSSMAASRKAPRRVSPRMEPCKKTVDKWVRENLEAPRKQRHTAKRIGARLEKEFGVTLACTTVRDAGSFGHRGRGGALAFADPESGIVFGYVVNGFRKSVTAAPRAHALVRAVRVVLATPTD